MEYASTYWAMADVFYDNVGSVRDAGRRVQRSGYDGLGDAPDYAKAFGDDTFDTTMAATLVGEAIHSQPTVRPTYRGMAISAEDLANYQPGSRFSMGLSSFSDAHSEAYNFAHDPSNGGLWGSQASGAEPVLLHLEPGARTAELRTTERSSAWGNSERVAFGQFEIVGVTRDLGVTNVVIRQTSLKEA